MSGRRLVLLTSLVAVALSACATDSGVATVAANQSDGDPFTLPNETLAPDEPDTTGPDPTVAPADTVPGRADELLNFGAEKQPRPYDEFLVNALNDVEVFWSEQYPLLYGEPFEPLTGGIYAGYPERSDPIPGCGPDSETSYDELVFFAAFYCPDGDFMAYDDGDEGLLVTLVDAFGPSVMGVVLAHEYGHAIQERAGILAEGPPTIYTEQQADCFSGAWVARAVRGEAPGVTLTDADIRAGLIALIQVRDPIGVDQLEPGGHGTGFDRVGAFQVGFSDGPARCAEIIDDPLPLMPNTLRANGNPNGNAPFGYDPAASPNGQMPGLVIADLNEYWTSILGGAADPFTEIDVVPFEDPSDVECDSLVGDPDVGALLCSDTGVVYFDEVKARDRYDQFGDFALGYMLGDAFSEAAQQSLGSPLEGEDRVLINDCLTGAWVSSLVPDANGATPRNAVIEAGDLDEAIQIALTVGDPGTNDDVLGSPFEKIASFRKGVLDGVPACQAMLED